MKVLVTGAAGFIGFHVARALLDRGDEVVGLDALTPYYDVALKRARLARFDGRNGFAFRQIDIAEPVSIMSLFAAERFDAVVHLAAQAGVRHSLDEPFSYVDANITGFLSVLEAARAHPVRHLVFASTSSVYGEDPQRPFRPDRPASHPVSLYAATKRANELMAHSYSALFAIPATGLRFFTVYGPWGRPDMALFLFTRKILDGEPVPIFNEGRMERDFTYVDDIVDGVLLALDRPPAPDPAGVDDGDPSRSSAPFRIHNIGCGRPIPLMEYVTALEAALGRAARLEFLPMQPGDVTATHADISAFAAETGYAPKVAVEEGVARFVAWYRDFYRV